MLDIKKIVLCNLYRLAAGEKDLAHGILCLDPSVILLDSQNFLAEFLRTHCKRTLFN